MLSRRDVSKALATTVALCGASLAAPSRQKRGKIDVHHHVGPPPGTGAAVPGTPEWSPRIAVEELDRNQVATAIGYPGPISTALPAESARKLTRLYNEYARSEEHTSELQSH